MSATTACHAAGESLHVPAAKRLLAYRTLLILFSQACLIAVAYYGAYLLASDCRLPVSSRRMMLYTLPVVLLVKLPIFYRFGLMSGWWRYVGMSDLLDIAMAAGSSSGVMYLLLVRLSPVHGFPLAVIIIDLLLTVVLIGGARFSVRAYTEFALQGYAAQKNTLIVGAGRAGSSIVRELRENPDLDYNPVGFVDDDLRKKGLKIQGLKVLGTTEDLEEIIAHHHIECVLIAIPSAKGTLVERIVSKCRKSQVSFKILPAGSQRMLGTSCVNQVHSVSVEDLLGREPVRLELESIHEKLQGKTALITGAGGSIGSELARQIALFHPGKLVLFERSESDLFRIGSELAEKFPHLSCVQAIGDILDVGVLRDVFSMWRPESVFHAAAYKHVPMMEQNCFQAITNNVFGTYNVALVASQYGVADFVMISSDKAVNPTNIMGVTKRVAELIILGLQDYRTRFIAVRFGNVLGSNGSVLPIFKQQLANGGPITVTHPEATRYFMTIPEAVQLVLQASSMGRGGEIFVLNMGEPVRIVDLAQNLIRLSGLIPDRDIAVVYTGLRPGEKLYEELMFEGEGLKPTLHDKIRVLDGGRPDLRQIQQWLDELSAMVEAKNVNGLIGKLQAIVPEYTPSREINALRQIDKHDLAWRYKRQSAGLAVVHASDVAA